MRNTLFKREGEKGEPAQTARNLKPEVAGNQVGAKCTHADLQAYIFCAFVAICQAGMGWANVAILAGDRPIIRYPMIMALAGLFFSLPQCIREMRRDTEGSRHGAWLRMGAAAALALGFWLLGSLRSFIFAHMGNNPMAHTGAAGIEPLMSTWCFVGWNLLCVLLSAKLAARIGTARDAEQAGNSGAPQRGPLTLADSSPSPAQTDSERKMLNP